MKPFSLSNIVKKKMLSNKVKAGPKSGPEAEKVQREIGRIMHTLATNIAKSAGQYTLQKKQQTVTKTAILRAAEMVGCPDTVLEKAKTDMMQHANDRAAKRKVKRIRTRFFKRFFNDAYFWFQAGALHLFQNIIEQLIESLIWNCEHTIGKLDLVSITKTLTKDSFQAVLGCTTSRLPVTTYVRSSHHDVPEE